MKGRKDDTGGFFSSTLPLFHSSFRPFPFFPLILSPFAVRQVLYSASASPLSSDRRRLRAG